MSKEPKKRNRSEYFKQYRSKNHESLKEYSREYSHEKYHEEWEYREKSLKRSRRWKEENPERYIELTEKYKSKKQQ